MGKVRLKVLTVPALDPVTYQDHTAFCVFAPSGKEINRAYGWTLKNAIQAYCNRFNINRDQIVLYRPFLPQRDLRDDGF